MAMFKWPLGYKAKDKITGFTGVITARSNFLTGCNRYTLESVVGSDGKRGEVAHFDENVLELVGSEPVFPAPSDVPAGPSAG